MLLDLPLLHRIVALGVDVEGLLVKTLLELLVPFALAFLPELKEVLQRVDVNVLGLVLLLRILILDDVIADREPLFLELLHPGFTALLEGLSKLPEVYMRALAAELLGEIAPLLFAFIVDHPEEALHHSDVEDRRHQLLHICRRILQGIGYAHPMFSALIHELPLLQPSALLLLQAPFGLVCGLGVRPAHEFVPEGLRVHIVHTRSHDAARGVRPLPRPRTFSDSP
mmetsp:Transcript_125828/g.281139  ORF Transcript_125828/g.281139 Transcript_125828/m.281139 type:complete len:226 (+) Transcript_125828:568-1245(+)